MIADQELVLKHRQAHEHQECMVAYLGPEQGGKMQIGLKFTHPNLSFWRIADPSKIGK